MSGPLHFQIGELESQMRDCALHENFEAAATILEQVRILRRERDELAAKAERPKVICIKSREAFVPKGKPKRERAPKKPPVDENSVELLEHALADAKNGLIHGIAMVHGVPSNNGTVVDVETATTDKAVSNLALFLGGLVILKDELIGTANDEMIPVAVGDDDED